ncbi:MAG: hypothetical protein ACRD7E_16285 [Bryobacteraceae bacterium]
MERQSGRYPAEQDIICSPDYQREAWIAADAVFIESAGGCTAWKITACEDARSTHRQNTAVWAMRYIDLQWAACQIAPVSVAKITLEQFRGLTLLEGP